MEIRNEKEIFDLFVEDENGLRYKLKTPFVDKYDGRVWATDGHNLIMVNPECVSGKYETRDMGGKSPSETITVMSRCSYQICRTLSKDARKSLR